MPIEEQVFDLFAENSVSKLEEIIQYNSNALKVSAALFIKNYIEVKDQIQTIEELSQKMQEMRRMAQKAGNNLPQEYEEYAKARKQLMTTAWWQKVQSNVDKFQTDLNAVLGQKISTVYVAASGRGANKKVHIYELPQGKFIKPGISSSGHVVGRYQVSLQSLKKAAIEIVPDDAHYSQALAETYLLALERYNKLKAQKIAGFYWKNSKNKYEMITVSNKGDIGEAFLHASLGKRKIMIGQNKEGNLKRFAKLVAQVDSGSGLLFGDFSGQNGIEYAAKTEGASVLGMQQMIKLAEEIILGQIVDKTTLQQKQKQYLAQSSLRNYIKTNIEENIDDLIRSILKT